MSKIINLVGKTPIPETYTKMLNLCGLNYEINSLNVLDGLLLAGGGDISPCLYGETNLYCYNVDLYRDIFELYLIEKYLRKNKCVFGICRGLQIINVHLSGTLIQHIDNASTHSQMGENKDKIHLIKNNELGFNYKLFGKNAVVNSAHHQAIKKLGKGLIAVSLSQDGIIEAVMHKNFNIMACQFHPERMNEQPLDAGTKIFDYFKSKL